MLNQSSLNAIFWDRPPFTLQQVRAILKQPNTLEYYWLLGRLVERLSPEQVFTLIDKQKLYALFPKLPIWKHWRSHKAAEFFPDIYHQS